MTGFSNAAGPEGKMSSLTLEIHQFSEIDLGKAYGGIPEVSLSGGKLQFGVGIGSSDKKFKLALLILGKNGKASDTLPDTTIDSVKVTMNPKSVTGKTAVFSNLQFSKTNKMTQVVSLLSKDEVAPFTQDDYMQLIITVLYDKPERKKSEKGKTPAWKIIVPVVVVLVIAGIAVGF